MDHGRGGRAGDPPPGVDGERADQWRRCPGVGIDSCNASAAVVPRPGGRDRSLVSGRHRMKARLWMLMGLPLVVMACGGGEEEQAASEADTAAVATEPGAMAMDTAGGMAGMGSQV